MFDLLSDFLSACASGNGMVSRLSFRFGTRRDGRSYPKPQMVLQVVPPTGVQEAREEINDYTRRIYGSQTFDELKSVSRDVVNSENLDDVDKQEILRLIDHKYQLLRITFGRA